VVDVVLDAVAQNLASCLLGREWCRGPVFLQAALLLLLLFEIQNDCLCLMIY
jgi:hypothetical protein